jgi:anti-sigma regulatory factor (Ser/Thr protein kinase)
MKKTRSFRHTPQSVIAARRFATAALQDAPAETLETVALMVSELASNCVRHTDSGFDLTIIQTRHEIRVEATDHGDGEPSMRSPKPTDPTGRGLQIVDMLAADWGFEHRPASGKTVWFTITPAPSSAETASSTSQPASYIPKKDATQQTRRRRRPPWAGDTRIAPRRIGAWEWTTGLGSVAAIARDPAAFQSDPYSA